MASSNLVLRDPQGKPITMNHESIEYELYPIQFQLYRHQGYETGCVASKSGTVYLTTDRMIFLSDLPKNTQSMGVPGVCDSFAVPYEHIVACRLMQPILFANYLELILPADPNGELDLGLHRLLLTFKKGGIYEFHNELIDISTKRLQTIPEPLPVYTP